MTNLRKANQNEAKKILEFYLNILKSIEGSEFKPKWNDSYPDLEFIEGSIKKGELYICDIDGDVAASLVLNNCFTPEYENIDWNVDAEADEIIVIHTFAVSNAGKGIGREIFNQIRKNALKKNKKTIRVDIIDGNIGALKVFERFGFEYIDTVEMFHPAVGCESFHLYELGLSR